MPTLNYILPYKINERVAMSPEEFRTLYLFGIDYRDQNGNPYSDESIRYHLANTQEEVEDLLSIKLYPQVIQETLDYDIRSFADWGYMRTTFPVRKPFSLAGFIGTTNQQINYPTSWLTARRTNDPNMGYERAMNIVPNGGALGAEFSGEAAYSTLYPFWGYSATEIPEYWQVEYTTGYDSIPRDLLSVIGKKAAIDILNVLGDNGSLGSGIASQSLSIDGLSQSVSSTASATSAANTARILQYKKELDKEMTTLRDKYVGLAWISC